MRAFLLIIASLLTSLIYATEIQIGDPNISYASVEFSKDGKFMIWYEGVNGNRTGKMWHCEVDLNTGNLIPSDCKGFSAFSTSVWGRANVGHDSQGPFYVGANLEGETILVRPTSSSTGKVTKLPSPVSRFRKGFYSTRMLYSEQAYAIWMEFTSQNDRTLQYIDLSKPEIVHNIETQTLDGRFPMVPMDIGFFRLVDGAPYVTYGAYDTNGNVQVKMKDLRDPLLPAKQVTFEENHHIDPYAFKTPNGQMYMVAGIDGQAKLFIYLYNETLQRFEKLGEVSVPNETVLINPILANSFEPIFKDGKILGSYQVNNAPIHGRGYIPTAFESPGEIWLFNVLNPSEKQIKLSGQHTMIRTEPEPVKGNQQNWVYFNASTDQGGIMDTIWKLIRVSVPANK